MTFTSIIFFKFLLSVLILYWLIPIKIIQNTLLLLSSYYFYGYIHPWFCLLIITSTVVDYTCGIGIEKFNKHKKYFLYISLISNLGLLITFKYLNFFIENFRYLFLNLGLEINLESLNIILPVGISFYTFQTLSYTIDLYRGKIKTNKNFIDFSLYVSFFPQLVAGPIERATHFLPQVQAKKVFCKDRFFSSFPLILKGFLKKLVIADNLAVYVDKIYMIDQPNPLLLAIGTFAFAFQIYSDFSAYTDIARGVARLFGYELIKNFNSPYLALNPSDFWNRWHKSLSSWVRDYLYIPLGGSRVKKLHYLGILLTSMGLSGLWHGAAWNYILWGFYHAIILYVYHIIGITGKWEAKNIYIKFFSWGVMFSLTLFGWALFRCPSIAWLTSNIFTGSNYKFDHTVFITSVYILISVLLLISPFALLLIEKYFIKKIWFLKGIFYTIYLSLIFLFSAPERVDFIYFQF